MHIRPALPADAPAIAAIYAHHVLTGTGTFEEEPPAVEEMAARMAHMSARGWPWLVAERDGRMAGYAYAAQFRDRSAYRHAGEDAIYVAADAQRLGVGAALLAALEPAAAAVGFRQMIAVIGDGGNAGSIGVHAAAGYREVGRLHGVGVKFGRVLDVVFMQKAIG